MRDNTRESKKPPRIAATLSKGEVRIILNFSETCLNSRCGCSGTIIHQIKCPATDRPFFDFAKESDSAGFVCSLDSALCGALG